MFVCIVLLGVCTAAVVEIVGKPSTKVKTHNDELEVAETRRQFGGGGYGGLWNNQFNFNETFQANESKYWKYLLFVLEIGYGSNFGGGHGGYGGLPIAIGGKL